MAIIYNESAYNSAVKRNIIANARKTWNQLPRAEEITKYLLQYGYTNNNDTYKDNFAGSLLKALETYGKYFDFRPVTPESWGDTFGFPYEVAVGPLGETRYAKIYKTVAYIVVGEDDNGDPVVEKWQIKMIWKKD